MLSASIDELGVDAAAKIALRELVASWRDHKGPVLFVGAGMPAFQSERKSDAPASSQMSTWTVLVDAMREKLVGGDIEAATRLGSDASRIAELFLTQFNARGLLDLVSKHVPSNHFAPGPAHERLRELPWAGVVTTNYDDLLERTFAPLRPISPIVIDQDLTSPRTIDHLEIVKMHGDLARPETIVLNEDSYRTFESERPGVAVKVKQLLVEHPLLFLGFGLADPNFIRIYGWVRDTVPRFQLPAVAVVHTPPIEAEREMWARRGIKLVLLPRAIEMADLIGALAHEHRRLLRIASQPPGYNRRVHDLEQEIRDAVQAVATGAAATDVVARVADRLGQIVEGAATDPDGGDEARSVARWLAAGWHTVLYPLVDLDDSSARREPLLRLRDIVDALSPLRRQRLLMLVLEAGAPAIRFDDATTLEVLPDLLRSGLASDDHAAALLHTAHIYRERGELAAAADALRKARAAASRRTMQARISAAMLDLLLLSGDAESIRQELERPDDSADVFATCRRASGYLLIGRRENAGRWYERALQNAVNGDERYVAMYGAAVATIDNAIDRSPETEERFRRMREIRADERPLTVAAERLRDGAGHKLLDGRRDEAKAGLQRYLSELRRLGWPQSSSHGLNTDIEIAARQAARLGLDAEDAQVDSILETITLLNTYGPAGDISRLLEARHLDLLGGEAASIAWFRAFTSATPTLPAQRASRITTAMRGLPLLGDDDLVRRIDDLIAQTDAWAADRGSQDLLPTWWKDAVRYAEHLPRIAAMRVLAASTRYAANAYVARVLEPGDVGNALWMWQRLGYIEPAAGAAIAAMAEQVFADPRIARDSWWQSAAIGLLEPAMGVGILASDDRARSLAAADARLGVAVDGGAGRHDTLRLASLLLDAAWPSLHLAALATRAVELVRKDLRSSALGETLYAVERLLPQVSARDREALADLLIGETERLASAAKDDRFQRGDLARGLSGLAAAAPEHRERLLTALRRLLARDLGLYGPSVKLDALSEAGGPEAVALVLSLLPIAGAHRPRIIRSVGWSLKDQPNVAATAPAVDMLIGLLIADVAETRLLAVHAMRRVFQSRGEDLEERRLRAFGVMRHLAAHDASWRVRAAALSVLLGLCRGPGDRQTVRPIVEAARTADIAILRRVSEMPTIEPSEA